MPCPPSAMPGSPLKLAPASLTKSSTMRGRWAKPGTRTSSYTEGYRGRGTHHRVRQGPCPPCGDGTSEAAEAEGEALQLWGI